MAKFNVVDMNGQHVSEIELSDAVFGETTHRFSRLSFHRAMVGRRLPLLLTASGLTWLAFAPDAERDAILSMLAARPEAEYQLAREPVLLFLYTVPEESYKASPIPEPLA